MYNIYNICIFIYINIHITYVYKQLKMVSRNKARIPEKIKYKRYLYLYGKKYSFMYSIL